MNEIINASQVKYNYGKFLVSHNKKYATEDYVNQKISELSGGTPDLESLSTVAKTGSYNDLEDTPTKKNFFI